MATIYDIARLANVSKSTVSRVLNNQSNISNDARERVLKAIEELNYQPSKLARGLSSGFDAILVLSRPTNTIEGNPFFSEILHVISNTAEENNYDVIIQTSINTEDSLEKCILKIQEKLIKGILMLSSPANEDFFQQLDPYNIPIVVVGHVSGHYQNVYSVDTDNYLDSYHLVQHLIEHGHKNIACLHSSLNIQVSIDRLEGYKTSLKDHDIQIRDEWMIDCGYTIENAYDAMTNLFQLESKPTAIFATDDTKMMGIYKYAIENKMNIPDDFSLIGYCNSNIIPFLNVLPTHVEIPIKDLGRVATSILFSKIKENKEVPKQTIIPTKTIIQGSVCQL